MLCLVRCINMLLRGMDVSGLAISVVEPWIWWGIHQTSLCQIIVRSGNWSYQKICRGSWHPLKNAIPVDRAVGAHEFRLRLPDGRVKWLRGDSLPERPTVDGTVLFHGLLTDVTERRLAEAKLRFTQFATDHAADAILWAGPDRRIMYVNVRATELLGYSREELLNLSMPILLLYRAESTFLTI